MPLIKNKLGEYVNFIHIPKTGGTTIENCFGGKKVNFASGVKLSSIRVTPQHFDRDVFKYLGVDNITEKSFAIVRHPIERLVSEYFHFQKNQKIWLSIEAFILHTFAKYKNDSYCYDNHIKPQVRFLLKDTVIYKFESGFSSIYFHASHDFNLHEHRELSISNKGEKESITLDPYFLRKVIDFYKEDFESFNYDIPELKYQSKLNVIVSNFRAYNSLCKFYLIKLSRKIINKKY